MDFLLTLLLFLHILGAAALVGGWLAHFKTPTVGVWQWAGALTQLLTGLLMVGLAEMQDSTLDYVWVAVKLLIALVVAVAAFLGRRRVKAGEDVPKGLAHAVGGMALVNIAVAVFWG